MRKFLLLLSLILISVTGWTQTISIGSKLHGESRLLAEMMAQTIEQNTDLTVKRRFGLGGTLICFEALRTGEIDIYPEYTGTALTAILHRDASGLSTEEVANQVAEGLKTTYSIIAGKSFGFNNTYVIAARPGLELKKLSELKGRTDLKPGFSNEFIERSDGFIGLDKHYNLGLEKPRGIDHGLAYKALSEGQIDLTDAYSTDGRLSTYDFQLLTDDQKFFPPYYAIPLINEKTATEYPEILEALKKLEGILDEKTMQQLNYQYEVDRKPLAEVANKFLTEKGIISQKPGTMASHPLLRQLIEHIQLTFLATFLAILLAVPLAIYISNKKRVAGFFLAATGVLQTIPSLALLGFMIPLFGIGFTPAIIALFLYALLPILRNTYTGLNATDPLLIEAGRAMGMTKSQILIQVRLPLAMDTIMAGIRTALIINIGTATLAAFIGAGGLGESIITGITLNDNSLILRGAIPAAILALVADQGMALVEKAVRPKGITKT